MSGHTKGPWVVDVGDGDLDSGARFKTHAKVMVYADGDCEIHPIADCSCNHTCRMEHEQEANARLIAAAPDLLEAARSGVECVLAGMGLDALANDDERNEVVQEILCRLDSINAVIARATGDA